MSEHKTVAEYRLKNGRYLRLQADGMWAVQPQNDNYWVERRTARAAMIAAGWGRTAADLVAYGLVGPAHCGFGGAPLRNG